MKIEDYTYKGEYGAIIHDENTNQRIFFTIEELRRIFDWVLENDKDIGAKIEWRILDRRLRLMEERNEE